MPYVTVSDLDQSLVAAVEKGGRVLRPAKSVGAWGHMAIVQDPAGATIALLMPPKEG
jgi:predicted enzyme related to lactoylglutathione lyase